MERILLNEVMEQQYQSLLSKAFSLLHNFHDAEDALQNAYLKAWTHIDSLRGEANCLSWLTKIVCNESLSLMRTRKRQPFYLLDEQLWSIPDQHNAVENCLDELTMHMLLERLSGSQRKVFYLRYAQGYSITSTASQLNLSEGTVKSQMFYARKKIKSYFEL
ncbi:MAG: RNA polymerase sigma factor, partial [Clostridia bacterium]